MANGVTLAKEKNFHFVTILLGLLRTTNFIYSAQLYVDYLMGPSYGFSGARRHGNITEIHE